MASGSLSIRIRGLDITHVYCVNSFSSDLHGGNPAGVVLDSSGHCEKAMLSIAREVGFSETAFIFDSQEANWEVRFFTPVEEVDLCGHATIATFHVLHTQQRIPPGRYSQKTRAGILEVEIRADHSILMSQNSPIFGNCIPHADIAKSLNTTSERLSDSPCQIVSTGLPDIIVPVQDLKTLHAIQPDFQAVAEISTEYNVTGYHLFCLETLNNNTAHCRNLAPRFGIHEESATGTASGALASYLIHHQLLRGDPQSIIFEQGHCMNRPSLIQVQLTMVNNEIQTVRVGGEATITNSIQIAI